MRYIFVILILLVCFDITVAEERSSSELLNKLEEAQKSLQIYIIKSEDIYEINDTAREEKTIWSRKISEFRRDNERVELITSNWDYMPEKNALNNIEDASIKSMIWDGENWFQYLPNKEVNRLFCSQDSIHIESINKEYAGSVLEGTFWGDEKSVTSILRNANNTKVRENMDVVDRVNCYVIDADTSYGNYSIWIAPEYGYNIVKADIHKNNGDILFGKQIGSTSKNSSGSINLKKQGGIPAIRSHTEFTFTLNNIHYEYIDNVWVPIEADLQRISKFNDGRVLTIKNYHKRTQVDLEPDFKAINAFIPDVPDGSYAYIENAPGIRYVWQEGKPILDIDQKFLNILDEKIENIKVDSEPDSIKTIENQSDIPIENSLPTSSVELDRQVNYPKKVLSEANSFPVLVIIVILFLLIVILGWYVIRRHKASSRE